MTMSLTREMRRKSCRFLSITSWAVYFAMIIGAGLAYAGHSKVTICHLPPGNPNNPQTISVGESAVSDHLRHGDSIGECPSGCLLNPTSCDDSNPCTFDVCLPTGQCDHRPIDCNDGNPCTYDSCDKSVGCVNSPENGLACDDSNPCTTRDTCSNGNCIGQPIENCCLSNSDCNDNNPCTIDSCSSNRCSNRPLDCSVSNNKCLTGYCDPATGACLTAPVTCNDSNVCTDDLCDPNIGCYSIPTATPPEIVETSCRDGIDNDCNGLADLADPNCRCDSPAPGICGQGVWIYKNGERFFCVPGVPQPEVCDGLDNDCDGAVDNGDVCS